MLATKRDHVAPGRSASSPIIGHPQVSSADPSRGLRRTAAPQRVACRVNDGWKFLRRGYPGGGHGVDGLAFIAGIIELVCGLLIALGLFTRIAAFLASGEMAVAYFMFYVGTVPTIESQFFPIMNGGELALVYCWVFFFMIFHTPGSWSVDALWCKDKSSAPSTDSNLGRVQV
ncbi:MAG: DoxX family protein [Verrucomicrobiota bacterium]|nr:DoxX family protein [Verrucomicrobiota bacterium]